MIHREERGKEKSNHLSSLFITDFMPVFDLRLTSGTCSCEIRIIYVKIRRLPTIICQLLWGHCKVFSSIWFVFVRLTTRKIQIDNRNYVSII